MYSSRKNPYPLYFDISPRIKQYRVVTVILVLIIFVLVDDMPAYADHRFRIGFTDIVFTDINENDVKAAMKVWGEQLARQRNIPVEVIPLFYRDESSLARDLMSKCVDVVGVTTAEYVKLLRSVAFDPIFMTRHDGVIAETYVLLAHKEGAIRRPADLRGHSLEIHSDLFTSLAPLWLDVFLMQQGLPPAKRLAGNIVMSSNLNDVLLPVFFRKSDTCLVSRTGFALASELNPQIAQHLVVLAESEPLVSALFAFRSDFDSPYRADILAALTELHTSLAGQQILNLLCGQALEEHPASILDPALELIDRYRGSTL